MPRGRGLPLHVAAASKASLGVVAALLEAFPDGAKQPDKNALGQDDKLPLQYAVENHAPADVQALLAKCTLSLPSLPARLASARLRFVVDLDDPDRLAQRNVNTAGTSPCVSGPDS